MACENIQDLQGTAARENLAHTRRGKEVKRIMRRPSAAR
jgi:hypothetical protein